MGATSYDRSLAGIWNVSQVVSFRSMFENSGYNRDLAPWEMSSATELDRMFYNASNFAQDLCNWQYYLPEEASVMDMFAGTSCPDQGDPNLSMLPVNPLCYNNCTLGTEAPSSAPSAESSTSLAPTSLAPTVSPVAPPPPTLAPVSIDTAAQEPTSGVASMSPMPALLLVVAWTVKRCLF